jgi:hypothetical protein
MKLLFLIFAIFMATYTNALSYAAPIPCGSTYCGQPDNGCRSQPWSCVDPATSTCGTGYVKNAGDPCSWTDVTMYVCDDNGNCGPYTRHGFCTPSMSCDFSADASTYAPIPEAVVAPEPTPQRRRRMQNRVTRRKKVRFLLTLSPRSEWTETKRSRFKRAFKAAQLKTWQKIY